MRSVDTVIVSDIHLGSKISQAKKLLETLKGYSFKRLILNGDVGDSPKINRLSEPQWEFLEYIRSLIDKGIEIVWINGNHDPHWTFIANLIGARTCGEYIWKNGSLKYLATHGHQFDRALASRKILSHGAIWVFDKIQLVAPKRKITRFIKNRARFRMPSKVAKAALAYGKTKKVDVILCGHTHRPLSILNDPSGVKYFNSGCWTDNTCSYIVVDENGPELVHVKK